MAQQEEMNLLVNVELESDKALKNASDLKKAIEAQKAVLDELKAKNETTTENYVEQEGILKQLNTQLAANQRVVAALADSTYQGAGAYAAANKEAADAARKAKDLAYAYGENSKAARDAAKEAKTLRDRIADVDSSVGQNQRRVGDYAGELGKLGGGFGATVGGAQNLGASLTMLKANPFFAILSVVVTLINAMSTALGSGTESGKKLQQVMAPLNDLMKGFTAIISSLVGAFADGVAAITSYVAGLLDFIPAVKSANDASRESVRIEKEKQALIREGILDKAADAKEELRISELKKKINEADKYSKAERLAFAREVDKAEKALALDDANRANENLKNFLERMKQQGKAQKNYTEDELKQLVDLQAAKYEEQQKYFDNTRKTASKEAALRESIYTDDQAKHSANIEAKKKKDAEYLEWRKKQTESEIKAFDDAQKKMLDARAAADKAVMDLQVAITTEEDEQDFGSVAKYMEDLEAAKTLIAESNELAYLDRQQTLLDAEYAAAIANAEKIGIDTAEIEKAHAEAKKKIAIQEISAKMDMASNFAGNIAEIFGKQTKVGKMAASAQIAIDTAKGAMGAISSFSSLGPIGIPLGAAAAGAVIAKGARGIKDVWAVKSGLKGDTGGGGGASVPSGGGGGGVAVASVTGSVVARQSGSTQQSATTNAMTDAMKAAPQTAVLVTNDVTTALDNKVQLKNDNSL